VLRALAAKLWPGKVHSAEGWDELLLPGSSDNSEWERTLHFGNRPVNPSFSIEVQG